MATVNFIKYERQSPSALSRVSDYVRQEQKTLQEDGGQLVSGQNCSPQFAAQEFLATRQTYRKDSPVYFYHYVQSFHPNEPVTGELAHEVATEFASQAWPESEVLIATHIDADHIHSHFIINAVCHESGKMLRQGPSTLARLRPISDEICLKYGLSVLPPQKRNKAQGMTGREYRAAVKGESWKFKLMGTIDDCMRYAAGREEFVALMKSEGYGVRWEDSRKSITYTTPTGMKCRDDRLHDERYLKGAMEHEFRIRNQIIHGGIEAAEYAAAKSTACAGADRSAPDAGGMAGSADAAQRTVSRDGGAEQAAGADGIQAHPLRYDGAGGGNIPPAFSDSDADRTGWEKERKAFLTAPAQNPFAAPVPGAAADSGHPAGVLGNVAQLGHALERAEHDAPPVTDATTIPRHVDSKAFRKTREKKIAAGHRPDDHEDEEITMQQTMY